MTNNVFSLEKINSIIDGEIDGDASIIIDGPCSIENGKAKHITYLKNNKYLKFLTETIASVIIVDQETKISNKLKKTIIRVNNPALAFIKYLKAFNKTTLINSIHKTSIIDPDVFIGKNVYIGHNVVIKSGTVINDNVKIEPNCVIDNNCVIGHNTIIKSNVSIYAKTDIGKDCKIESGCIIGSSGFGLLTIDKKHQQIPHVGKVIIKDNVLLGSNCTIDRGTIENTIINEGTKFDNIVHVGHNVIIGKNCIICAQVGIGGSTIIGNDVIIGGQTGIIDHLKISDNVVIGPKSYVIKSINNGSYFSGNPARNHKDHLKQDILISKLPEIYKKIKKI